MQGDEDRNEMHLSATKRRDKSITPPRVAMAEFRYGMSRR